MTVLAENGRVLDRIQTPIPPTDVMAEPSGMLLITARTHVHRVVPVKFKEKTQ